MKEFFKKVAGYLAAFFAGAVAVLALVLAATLGKGRINPGMEDKDDGKEDDGLSGGPGVDPGADSANRDAAISRALDRARKLSSAHQLDGGGALGDPVTGDGRGGSPGAPGKTGG